MRGLRSWVGVLAIGATMGTLGACSHSNTEYGELAPANAVAVHIDNQNFLDMDVYAVGEGLSTRLGTVTGNSARNFVVSAAMTNQNFSIVATPVGGNGRASTGNISASPGQTIDFRIAPAIQNSTVFIRP